MDLRSVANRTIAPAQNKQVLLKDTYRTDDIVKAVFRCYEACNSQVKQFAPALRGATIYETCRNIWNFLKRNIAYRIDPPGDQFIKEPARVWADKYCDCKSYSIFIASLLKHLGIRGVFRFVSYDADPQPTHVYIVVRSRGRDIIIDDVMPRFDAEKKYTYKKDYPMSGLYRVSGLPPAPATRPRVSSVSLPVMGCCDSAPAVSGLLDPIKRLLSGSKAHDLLVQLAPIWLYAYLPQPAGGFKDPSATAFWNSMPIKVKYKFNGIQQLGEWVNDHWGFTNTQAGEIQYNTLRSLLGMPPQKYLALVINADIMNYRDNSLFCSQHNHCLSGIGVGGLLDTINQTGQSAVPGGDTAAGDTATQFNPAQLISDLAGSLINYDIPSNLQPDVIGPASTDWIGYKTRLKVGVVPPTPGDPLGAGINNGLYDSNGNPLPKSQQTGVTSQQAGMSPLIMIGLAGAAAALLFAKKKKGGRK